MPGVEGRNSQTGSFCPLQKSQGIPTLGYMATQTKTSNTVKVVREMGKEKRAGKNPGAGQNPKLHYEFIESETGEQGLNAAFDILFREVFYRNVEKHD